MAHFKWLPVIDEEKCTACNACVDACGQECLGIVDFSYVVLTKADVCGSEAHCIAPCPQECISMQWVPCNGDLTSGKWKS